MKYIHLIFGLIALGFIIDIGAQKVGWLRAIFYTLCCFFAVMHVWVQILKLLGV